jgi:hypothetical protein
MTRLLLFLGLVGVAIYTLLIFTHDALTDGKVEKTYAGQTQPNQPGPHPTSWDAYLPDRSSNQNPQLAASQLSTPLAPRQSDEPSQNLERSADQLAPSENKATSGSDGAAPEPVERAKVVLAAQTHSEASVSSPTVRFYRPGTELQVVRREGIWSEVSDPVTQERGWVLGQYLSSIDGPSPTQVATEATTEPLTVAPVSPKSNKRHRSAKSAVRDGVVFANKGTWNGRRYAERRGLFMFHPFGRWAQRR